MKKLSLLIAMIAFVCGNTFAQLSYDFEDGTAGAKIAETYGEPWTTWSGAVGGSEDGVFAELGGTMAAYFTYGNDQVLKLGDLVTGVYEISFDMYIPDGKNAYNNVLHVFEPSKGSEYATEVYYKHSSNGTCIKTEGGTTNFDCPYDTWFNVKYLVDLNTDNATFYIDGVEIHSWQFSVQSSGGAGTRQLGAMDFFPPANAETSMYYLDNVVMEPVVDIEEIVNENFEDYTVGDRIAANAPAGHDWWTTWSGTVGGSEDGVVADYAGSQCAHFTYGNDQVLLLGDQTDGFFTVNFDMYIPDGKNAYNNILHVYEPSKGSEWATEVHFKTSDHGTSIEVNGNYTNFECPYDAWFNVKYEIDFSNDQATFFIDDAEVVTWQFSTQASGGAGTRQLAAVDFYPPTNAGTSEYYVDNISVVKESGAAVPRFVITPESVEETMPEDEFTSVEITIENQGTSIGDWSGWLDFGVGEGGSATTQINYDAEPGDNSSLVGYSWTVPTTVEIATMFPGSLYAGAAMGCKIVSAQYFIVPSTSGFGIEEGTNLIFRVYKQGMSGQPGEVLAEKVVPFAQINQEDWTVATFDTPVDLTGFDVWISVEYTQAVGGYAMVFDGMEYVENSGFMRTSSTGAFSPLGPDNMSSDYGCLHLRANVQGNPVPASWATLDKTNGTVLGGDTEIVTLNLNTLLLTEPSYEATFIINTNDTQLEHMEIPVKLFVSGVGVNENASDVYEIYPNPASTSVTLKGENLSHVAIYNVAGQLVRVMKLENVVNTINMDVESGVYFFSIYDNNGNNVVQRVVVSK